MFGSLGKSGKFNEDSPYKPNSPYSASKASSDHLVRAWGETYNLPVIITNCSNNFGPRQHPEKLIPKMITSAINKEPLTIYGDGSNIRDWIFVEDHVEALILIALKSAPFETYTICSNNEYSNLEIVHFICKIIDANSKYSSSLELIEFVNDRPGHDFRYAIDATKLESKLGWKPSLQFEEGLSKTIDWYLSNQEWLEDVTTGEYKTYYQEQYQNK